jgi:hypothetical protein
MNRPIVAKEAVSRLKLNVHDITTAHHALRIFSAQSVPPPRQQA